MALEARKTISAMATAIRIKFPVNHVGLALLPCGPCQLYTLRGLVDPVPLAEAFLKVVSVIKGTQILDHVVSGFERPLQVEQQVSLPLSVKVFEHGLICALCICTWFLTTALREFYVAKVATYVTI